MRITCTTTMGCTNNKSVAIHDSSHNPRDKRMFLDSEIGMIIKTWRRYLNNDMVGNGSKVFIKIFDLAPFVKEVFGFQSMSKDAMNVHPRFRLHAGRFMQAVGAAVENVHSLSLDKDVAPILQALGGKHQHYTGFDIDYIDVFNRALMEVWQEMLGDDFTPECQKAWAKIFVYVITEFKNGYVKGNNVN